MQMPIPVFEWRVLRQALRSKKPSRGTALRVEMLQRTKDGAFLDALVRLGLLKVAAQGESPMESTYTLTERGKHAAGYGVYEIGFDEYSAARKG